MQRPRRKGRRDRGRPKQPEWQAFESARRRKLFLDLALQRECTLRKLAVGRLEQEIVKAAAMLERPQRRSGDAQANGPAERIGNQRDIAEIRQKAGARLAIGVADFIAALDGLAGQFATA